MATKPRGRLRQRDDVRSAVADELADVLIYCLALANVLDVDLGDAVLAKLARNQERFPPGQLPSRHRLLNGVDGLTAM